MNKIIQAGGNALLLTAALAVFAACSLGGDLEAWRVKAKGEENGTDNQQPPATSYTVTPDSTTGTTALNFSFSAYVSSLYASDISIASGTGSVTKGTPSGSGTSWMLPVTVNTAGTIHVSINKSGIENGTKTVNVYKSSAGTYSVTPDSTSNTTSLNFTFSSGVSSLYASDISITSGTGSVTKGTPSGSGTSWTLPVTVNTAGTIHVSINKSGIESGTKTVNVYKSDGTYSVTPDSTTSTTALYFSFSTYVSSLYASDISITSGTGSVTKGTPSGSGTSWTLPITVNTAGTIHVSINKSGIESGTKTVSVYKGDIVILLNSNPPYGWQYFEGIEEAYTGTKTNIGDMFTFTYSFKSNVFIDKLQVVLIDCDEPDYVWKTLSNYVPVSENIQPNTVITGSISITATGTAASASFLANRLVIETTAGTSSQPTLTFTAISLVKTKSAITATGSTLAAQLSWLKNNAASNSSYILTANASESIVPQDLSWSGKDNITVFLQGDYTTRTISLSAQGSMFTVGSGVTLILDNNITLQGRSDNTLALVTVNGTLEMKGNTKITGNTNTSSSDSVFGGGVYVFFGSFSMHDSATVSNNTITNFASDGAYGGGVYVLYGSFSMQDNATVSNNTITGSRGAYGGGVFVDDYGSFSMQDNATVSNNTITGSSVALGGGVYGYYGSFTMRDNAIISGNTVSASYGSGGGIYINSSSFRMAGGIVYGSSASSTLRNTASYGAALYGTAEYGVYSGETFYKSGNLTTTNDTIRVQNGNLYNN